MTVERFTIEELTGDRRSISLGGRALPYPGVAWGATMRNKKTWYAGNPRGTLQVLGPEYDPTDLSGCWKDRFFAIDRAGAASVTAVGFPDLEEISQQNVDKLIAAFYSILQAGNALRVQWRAEVREGILAHFVPTYGRPTGTDVEWSMSFEWIAKDEAPATAAPAEAEPRGALREELGNVDAASDSRPAQVNATTRGIVAETQFDTRSLAGQMFDAFSSMGGARGPLQPLDGVAALLSLTEQMRVELDAEREQIESVPVQLTTLSDRAVDLMNVDAWRRTLDFEQGKLRDGCLRRAASAQNRVAPGSMVIVKVPGATTLRTLSLIYYGTADSWKQIADINDLTESLVPAGTTLVIPPAR